MKSLTNDFLMCLLSPNTKTAYKTDLKQAEQFLGIPLQIANSEQVSAYRDSLIALERSPGTINRKFSALRNFYKWAIKRGHIQTNPVDLIELPKWEVKDPTNALMDKEVVVLIDRPDVTTFQGNGHRLVLSLLLYLGFRRTELTQLKLKDIMTDAEHVFFRVKGKGGKYRRLPINKLLMAEIEAYKARFENFTNRKLTGEDYLIQTAPSRSTQADPSTIYRIVKRYAERVNISRPIGPHSCRATVISHLMDTKKVPIRDVADFAGHANTATTQIYDKKRNGMKDSAAYLVGY